jgi:IstB-like ATP binding protein
LALCTLFSDRALALHNAIKSLDDDLALSNPTTFVMLPFPSLDPAPLQRFETTEEKGIGYFRYMGRSKFTELNDYIKRSTFVRGQEDLYLYGSSGSGKSHILAAMVCQLIREGKRVVYIPNCCDLLKDVEKTIRVALYCAFYDDPTSLQTINSARDVKGLADFLGTVRDKYLVVGQLNALEIDPGHKNFKDAKKYLRSMSCGHRYIFSASANEQSNRDVDAKQASITVIPFLGGMGKVR